MEENIPGLRVTMSQIAAAAGVSVPTVSKVINQRSDVAPATRERVEQVIRESGYVINRVARTLRQGRSGLIDVFVEALNQPETGEVLRGIEEALLTTDVRLVLSSLRDLQTQPWTRRLSDGSTDGALLLLLSPRALPKIEELQYKHIPFVAIDLLGSLHSTTPSVGATNWYAGKAATSYLLSLGHRRIAPLLASAQLPVTRERLAGYRSALEEATLRFDPTLVCYANADLPSTTLTIQQLLALPDPPTALFVESDEQCFAVYRALSALHLRIPEDISVLGFGDLFYSALLTPPLTTIRQPLQEMGKMATTMLLRLIEGEPLDTLRVEMATPLIKRESCTSPTANG